MNLVKYWPWPSNAVFKKLNQNFNVPSRVANAVSFDQVNFFNGLKIFWYVSCTSVVQLFSTPSPTTTRNRKAE